MGLQYLHETVNIIHRDLKASHILINGKGQCKLIGFHDSFFIDPKNDGRTVIGTPYWVALLIGWHSLLGGT